MKALVTGGVGFIGSNLVDALLQRGDDVVVFDHRAAVPSDVCDDVAVQALLTPDVDVVVHLAAKTSVIDTITDPAGTFRTNLEATVRLAEQCRRQGIKRFVFASTSAAVGAGAGAGGLIDEDSTLAPLTPYGASKAAAECALSAYRHAYGIDVVSLRFTNVYGPGMEAANKRTAVAQMLRAARDGHEFDLYGDGHHVRDYVFVTDVVDALLAAADGAVGADVVCFGSGMSVSVLELADIVGQVTGRPLNIRTQPPRDGEMPAVRVGLARARLYGLVARVPLEEGLSRTWLPAGAPAARGD
jgi:UDP-glucose 4-epimerase